MIKSVKRSTEIIFIIISIVVILEFIFIRGMFSGPIMMILISLIGLINIILEYMDKQYLSATRYLITTIALCMGYFAFM